MTTKVDTMVVGVRDDKVVLMVNGWLFLMTPEAARIYADLMVHAADWLNPGVAPPRWGAD